MDETTAKSVAAQLRKPSGEWAVQIASFMSKGNSLLIDRTIKEVAAANHDDILEIGMGDGNFVKNLFFTADSIRYTGYDYSAEMVELSTTNNEKYVAVGMAKFVHGNANRMPFADNEFDKIFTINTVYFWDDIAAITSEIKRVLKPDGKLVLGLRPERLMKTYPMTKYGFRLYSAESIKQLMEVSGFVVTSLLEEDEPPQEVDGEILQLSSLIVSASPTG